MITIGLTGSIGMGKSEAARFFKTKGFPVFDSDAEVHKLYDSQEGLDLIKPLVPEAISVGKIDRTKITAAILQNPTLLSQLEKAVHQEIKIRRETFLNQTRQAKYPAAILDIPLLFEIGADKDLDHTILISAQPEIQKARVMARPGMTEERFAMIKSRQMLDAEKRSRAEIIIENNGTIAELHTHLAATLQKWNLDNA